MKLLLKILTPILLIVAILFVSKYLIETGPKAKKKPAKERTPVVEVVTLHSQTYVSSVNTSGVVKAGIQSNLVAEVSGKVLRVSELFKEGSYFNKNSELVVIDKANYLNAIRIAESDVVANQASLKQLASEQKSSQRSIQLASRNLALGRKEVLRLRGLWKKRIIARSQLDAEEQKLNQLAQRSQELQGKQNSFASRRVALQAKINSAKARLTQEKLKLSRTIIRAPYAGRVLKKNVDVGQFVSMGTLLGQIYATDYVNVELPLSLAQYTLLNMPESFSNAAATAATKKTQTTKIKSKQKFPKVSFSYSDGLHENKWQGQIVRSSASLDAESRQMVVIARIDKPFEKKAGTRSPVRIGQYLKAKIQGKTFKKVFVLPPSSVRHNREVMLLKNGTINIVPVTVVLNETDVTVVKVAPEYAIDGQQLITTSLSQAMQGMRVITLEAQQQINKKANQANILKNNKNNDLKNKSQHKDTQTK